MGYTVALWGADLRHFSQVLVVTRMACLWNPSGCIKNVNLGGKQLKYYACLFAAILIIQRQHLWRCCHLTTMPLCSCACINGLVLFLIPNFNDVYISAHPQMYIFANVPKIWGPTVGEHRISLRLDRRTRTGNVYWAIRDFTGVSATGLDRRNIVVSWGFHGGFMGISWWFHGDFMVISRGLHGATCWHVLLPRNPAIQWGDDKKYIIKTMSSRDLNALKGVIDAHPVWKECGDGFRQKNPSTKENVYID